jgi:hypothetical protein
LRHPVVEIFIDVKWKKVRKIFVANFITYCIFLVAVLSTLNIDMGPMF